MGDKRHDRGQATRQDILTTATRLFTTEGYEGTSIDLVLRTSGISRGALYHHFVSKEALFAAVLEEVEAQIARQVSAAAHGAPNPRAALRTGCTAWLVLARDPTVKRIVLIDAPAVVGWDAWRAMDSRHVLGLLKAGLHQAAAAGWGREDMVEMHAHMVLAVLIEVALLIARSEDAPTAIHAGQRAVEQLLNAIVGGETGTE